ncbi:MAG TPA: hypothetical protein VEJ21_03345, partial [Acidimicrobiales bacterium]|nr:hypothetical protein [Acidimicrobiales bacterium]
SIYRAGIERATTLKEAVNLYGEAVTNASRVRAGQLQAALHDHDEAISRATAVFEEAFRAGDELVAAGALASSPSDGEGGDVHGQPGEPEETSTKTAG